MTLAKRFFGLVLVALAASLSLAADKPAAALPPILPLQFHGWEAQGTAQSSVDPRAADPTNAAVLKEYGFTDFAGATYTKADGSTLKIRAARFADASGAFGAYTFYLQPDMRRETIGKQAASLGQRVLFYNGQILIDALFSQQSAMSGAELRELAGALPQPSGNAANLPSFLELMPLRGYVTNTQKYVLGPTALNALGSPVPADLVDFHISPEVLLGHYGTSSGEATLMLISYPTPQLAAKQEQQIDAAHHITPPQPGVSSIQKAGEFFEKRTGPILVIASGPLSDSDAKSLLGMVNYEANVTWNQRTLLDKNNDLGGLLVNIIILSFILGAMALVAGVAFGGIRILMRTLYPNRIFDRSEQMEFISLHLAEATPEGTPSGDSRTGGKPGETPSNSQ